MRRAPTCQMWTATMQTQPEPQSRPAADFPVEDTSQPEDHAIRARRADHFRLTRARRSDESPRASQDFDKYPGKSAAPLEPPRRVSRAGISHTASDVRMSVDRNSSRRSSASSGESDPDRRAARPCCQRARSRGANRIRSSRRFRCPGSRAVQRIRSSALAWRAG